MSAPDPDPPARSAAARWADARLAAELFAIDPAGLAGLAVIAGAGPVRDLWTDILRGALAAEMPIRRLPSGIEDDRLLGGIDLVATLRAGRPVLQTGLLGEADGGIVMIPMAERLPAGTAARLAGVLDQGHVEIQRDGLSRRVPARIGIVAFDEAASDEERIPAVLAARLACFVDLRDIGLRDLDPAPPDAAALAAARARLGAVAPASDEIIEALAATAMAFGIESAVPLLLALRMARVAAALAGRLTIEAEDAVTAVRLVLAPRAQSIPAAEGESEAAPKERPPAEDGPAEDQKEDPDAVPPEPSAEAPSLEDILLAAVQAALPENLLATMKTGGRPSGPTSPGGGAGRPQPAALRGRPIGVRAGSMRAGARLALVDTLRAAAPWQALRRAEAPVGDAPRRVAVRAPDIRLRRFARRRETTIVFCVDASGSAAFHRLAEAKGAVELLLGEAYVARTHAALVVFRGKSADLLLPPTRSLSRAKALLASLPGGGGTPLASGIDTALLVALGERRKGRDPLIVLLTDGRGNIGRDGLPARTGAAVEALAAARQIASQQLATVFIDTAPRPRGEAAELAAAMGARYVALPYVEAAAVRDVVRAASPVPQPSRR